MSSESQIENKLIPVTYAAILISLWFITFQDAISSAIGIWYSSKTFNHCFFVLPIFFYLVWTKRHSLSFNNIAPNYYLLLPITVTIAVWVLGVAGNVQILTHIGAFSVLPLSIWLIVGNRITRLIWFPLSYMLFMIPVGEQLVPWLQQVTGDISVGLLKLTGIPVFRDGLYISIPAGNFEVAVACSGIRFFISTLMLASLYAYITYKSVVRASMFMLIALVLPIFANGVRAYGTIMVGHFFGLEYAGGTDHLVYGWVFFALVLILLFWLGSLLEGAIDRKTTPLITDLASDRKFNVGALNSSCKKAGLVLAISLLIANLWVMNIGVHKGKPMPVNTSVLAQAGLENLSLKEWQPQFSKAYQVLQGTFAKDNIEFFLAWYPYNTASSEMIAWENKIYRSDKWSLNDRIQRQLIIDDHVLNLALLDLRTIDGRKRLVGYWYQIPGLSSSSETIIKLKQAWHKVIGENGEGAIIAFSKEYKASHDNVEKELIRSVTEMSKIILTAIPFKEK